jgi:hypothetical protein
MNYELKKTETNNKKAKFFYEVVNENDEVISTRHSNREYVACTIRGTFYFGRLDLIGKGEHGRFIRDWEKREEQKEALKSITTIAYIK